MLVYCDELKERGFGLLDGGEHGRSIATMEASEKEGVLK